MRRARPRVSISRRSVAEGKARRVEIGGRDRERSFQVLEARPGTMLAMARGSAEAGRDCGEQAHHEHQRIERRNVFTADPIAAGAPDRTASPRTAPRRRPLPWMSRRYGWEGGLPALTPEGARMSKCLCSATRQDQYDFTHPDPGRSGVPSPCSRGACRTIVAAFLVGRLGYDPWDFRRTAVLVQRDVGDVARIRGRTSPVSTFSASISRRPPWRCGREVHARFRRHQLAA